MLILLFPQNSSDRVQRQIDRLLDEAEGAITGQEWGTVGDHARSVLRLDPENSDALSYLAAAVVREQSQPFTIEELELDGPVAGHF